MQKFIEESVIGGKVIRLAHEDVPLGRVELDQRNPRIRYRLLLQVANNKQPTEQELEKIILALPEVKMLCRNIEQNGGLQEKVILQEDGNNFKAIEGNCRLTCFRHLHQKHPTDDRWKKIPARILPSDIDPKHVAILLTGFHVAGKIKWEAHEKAGASCR